MLINNQKAMGKQFEFIFIQQTSHLRLVAPESGVLMIGACPGGPGASLAYAHKTFTRGVNPGFRTLKLDTPQPATEMTAVLVYELYDKDDTLLNIYSSFDINKKDLAFKSQKQIEKFVIQYYGLFQGKYEAFFLFTEKVNGKEEFFVAFVLINDAGESLVYPFQLSDDLTWFAKDNIKFVIPARNLSIH